MLLLFWLLISAYTIHHKKHPNPPPPQITTPIYYLNGSPHIGHAYTSISTDILSRYNSLNGLSVSLQTGVDEHGEKVAKKAEDQGMEAQVFCDGVKMEVRTHGVNVTTVRRP